MQLKGILIDMDPKLNDTVPTSINQLVAVLKNSGAKTVYLFGSAAKGTMRSDSDVDLAVSGFSVPYE